MIVSTMIKVALLLTIALLVPVQCNNHGQQEAEDNEFAEFEDFDESEGVTDEVQGTVRCLYRNSYKALECVRFTSRRELCW